MVTRGYLLIFGCLCHAKQAIFLKVFPGFGHFGRSSFFERLAELSDHLCLSPNNIVLHDIIHYLLNTSGLYAEFLCLYRVPPRPHFMCLIHVVQRLTALGCLRRPIVITCASSSTSGIYSLVNNFMQICTVSENIQGVLQC